MTDRSAPFRRADFRGGIELRPTSGISAVSPPSGARRTAAEIVAVADNAQWLNARVETRTAGPGPVGLGAFSDPILATASRCGDRAITNGGLRLAGDAAYVGIERNHAVIRFDSPARAPSSAARRFRFRTRPGTFRATAASKRSASRRSARPCRRPRRHRRAQPRRRDGADDGLHPHGAAPGHFPGRHSDGFDVTDLAFLPDGDARALERRFSLLGLGCRLRRVQPAAFRPGARVDGDIVRERILAEGRQHGRPRNPSRGRRNRRLHDLGRQFLAAAENPVARILAPGLSHEERCLPGGQVPLFSSFFACRYSFVSLEALGFRQLSSCHAGPMPIVAPGVRIEGLRRPGGGTGDLRRDERP